MDENTPKKPLKLMVSVGLNDVFLKVQDSLMSRGVEIGFLEFSNFLTTLITQDKIDEFIDQMTPLEFKFKEALLDPSKREALEKLLNTKKKNSSLKQNESIQ